MSNLVSAIIVAAGSSTRMGTGDSKQFIPLFGKPAIEYTLRAFQDSKTVSEIIVVCREQDSLRIRELADKIGITKLSQLVKGGESRAQSVQNGISAVSAEAKYLAIHDGARPLISSEEINRVLERAFETGAATLGGRYRLRRYLTVRCTNSRLTRQVTSLTVLRTTARLSKT